MEWTRFSGPAAAVHHKRYLGILKAEGYTVRYDKAEARIYIAATVAEIAEAWRTLFADALGMYPQV